LVWKRESPGLTSQEAFAKEIAKILKSGSRDVKILSRGRVAVWKNASQTIMIYNPNDPDLGTAIKPKMGRKYFDEQ